MSRAAQQTESKRPLVVTVSMLQNVYMDLTESLKYLLDFIPLIRSIFIYIVCTQHYNS